MYLLSQIDTNKKYHYVYQLICIETGQTYIGSRSSNVVPESDAYWSSSDVVKKMISEGYTFTKKILQTYPTRTDAVEQEILLHNIYDVGRNSEFLNQVKQTSSGFDTTGRKFPGKGVGRKDTKQARTNKSAAAGKHLKGKSLSNDHKKKIAGSMKGKSPAAKTQEGIKKLRQLGIGRVPGNKGKQKLKTICRLSDRKEMDLGNFLRWQYK